MDYFAKMDGSEFELLREDLTSAQQSLQAAYDGANQLQSQIKGNDWEGQAKKEMQAYMDLLLQYHGALIGKTNGSNPVQEGLDALKQLENNLSAFYSGCEAFQKLEKI